jgi:hypothetical protein
MTPSPGAWRLAGARPNPHVQALRVFFFHQAVARAWNCAIIAVSVAGWSSLVARWAHNPKVVGSNPAPATKFMMNEPVDNDGLFYSPVILQKDRLTAGKPHLARGGAVW